MAKPRLEHPLLRDHTRLQNCLHFHNHNVKFGDSGDFVFAIQMALITLDQASIDPVELQRKSFQVSTRAAVRDYKQKRKIINFSYQNSVDDVVGKMTIERLDNDLLGHKHASDPLTDPGEPARIQRVLNRERPAVARIIERSISLLRELRDAVALKNEEPGKLLRFEASNPLVTDALRRFCGMSISPQIGLIDQVIREYEAFRAKLPNLPRDQKPTDFAGLLVRSPENITSTADGPSFPPAIADAPAGMFFTPRYRDIDATQRPLFRGLAPATLQLIQLHEMGHFYFGFDDGDPRGKPFSVSRRLAQTYEFVAKQAVFRLRAP